MDEGKLKINMIPKGPDEPTSDNRLKGNLVERSKKANLEEYSENWLKEKIFIQRDGPEEFKVEGIGDGSGSKRIVRLVSLKDGHSLTKEINQLINDIKIQGSPWELKK